MTNWEPFGKTFGELIKEFEQRHESLVGCQVQTQVDCFLIGHVNAAGGVCDDCVDLNRQDVVTRYRRLVDPIDLYP